MVEVRATERRDETKVESGRDSINKKEAGSHREGCCHRCKVFYLDVASRPELQV